MSEVNLLPPQVVDDLLAIYNVSPDADVTIVVGTSGGKRESLFFPAAVPSNGASATSRSSKSGAESATKVEDVRDESVGRSIFACASVTKIWIAYAICLYVLLPDHKFSLDMAAAIVYYHLTGMEIEIPGDPTIRQLLHHDTSFAPMNKILLAPDQTFLPNMKQFLEIAPKFSDEYIPKNESRWFLYSNANYIFLGRILELAMGKSLQKVLEELVFDKLGLKDTAIDLESVMRSDFAARLVKGFNITSDGTRVEVDGKAYLNDTTESACMGLRTSFNDMSSLCEEFLCARHRSSAEIEAGKHDIKLFNGRLTSFAGFVSHPEEEMYQYETPTRHLYEGEKSLLGLTKYEPKALGKKIRSQAEAQHIARVTEKLPKDKADQIFSCVTQKAGYIDGSSCNVIFFEQLNKYIIIHANTTGPFDVVHHISRYFLQQTLVLKPAINIVQSAREEFEICKKSLRKLEQLILARYFPDQLAKPDSAAVAKADREGKLDLKGKLPAGTYKHTKRDHRITLYDDGSVVFHMGGTKRSGLMRMKFTKADRSAVRFLIDADVLPIDCWSTWAKPEFGVEVHNYAVCLVRRGEQGGDDIYSYVGE